MIAIEDLMKLGYSKRQVQDIAASMGYPKANEYPEAVRDELIARKSVKGKSRVEQTTDEATQQHAASMGIDLQDVDEGAQRRAAAMSVGRDALTLYYLATGNFTVAGLKDTVDNSRNQLRQALRGEFYEPEAFLSQMALGGMTGTTRSLNGSDETLTSSTASDAVEPCDTASSAS